MDADIRLRLEHKPAAVLCEECGATDAAVVVSITTRKHYCGGICFWYGNPAAPSKVLIKAAGEVS